ncbi:MAG: hypothetical protein RR314_04160 [Oscillospiraceae bacterium]
MTPKEILYLDDALAHEQFLSSQCREAAATLRDAQLQQKARDMADTHCRIYTQLFNLI